MCDCGMERLPPGVRACSACEVASRWADRYAALLAERDAALARAEQAERERDAAEREAERWRHGVPVEGDYVCPNDLRAYHAEHALRRAEARAAVVVWGQWAGVLGIDHDGDSWALVVSRGEPESNTGWDVEEFAFPRTCDDILRDIPDHAVDAIAAAHGCPTRGEWEGVRDAD